MLLLSLLLIPLFGVLAILVNKDNKVSLTNVKLIGLTASIVNLFISLIIFILFDFSTNQFQFVQEYHQISYFDFYLGVDGLSIYFVLLTTIIIPISLLSNWTSISKDVESYVIIILLLETLLLAVFLVLDILLFYIFFESILPPLFILIGVFGSDNRVKASFYLFLYTLLGSLFLLLSILAMSSIMSTTDFDTLFKGNFVYLTQLFIFYGIFIAFAVKTPTIFLNTWLLKAHVESPLGGSIILAAIVLKLSLYGILRLILPVLPKAYMDYTYIIYLIGVITIIYASLSTLRTIDVKELIAYSSVSHAAVYLLGVFSNSLQGIEGSINLGLAHGLVSPGLFICAGGILYDRSHTRLIAFYRGMAQIMPLFAIFFFILCLANCGAPLTLNFIGEFLSLYGVFERSSLYGVFASSSIVFSAAYSMYMYQKISFGGAYSRMFTVNIPDLNKREFVVLLTLVVPTVLFGIYPAPILDGLHYSVTTLIYSFDLVLAHCDAPRDWGLYFQDSASTHMQALGLIQVAISRNFQSSLSPISNKYLNNGSSVPTHKCSNVNLNGLLNFNIFSVIAQLFSDYLRILKDICTSGLEWTLHNPPKPHAFTSLPLQSGMINDKWFIDPKTFVNKDPLIQARFTAYQTLRNRYINNMPLYEHEYRELLGHFKWMEDVYRDRILNGLPSQVKHNVQEAKNAMAEQKEILGIIDRMSFTFRAPLNSSNNGTTGNTTGGNTGGTTGGNTGGTTGGNTNYVLPVVGTSFIQRLSLFNKEIFTIVRPYFTVIIPLVLSCLVYFKFYNISELYTMLINIAGVYVVSVIVILFTVLLFLIKLLLMIRRANKSNGLYDRLFNFVIKNFSSIVVYFIIILVSVVLVFSCGGFVLDSSYMFNSLF